MICGSKVLRGVLLLRVGFKDIAVGTDMTFLIAMDVAILVCPAMICACPAASIGAANAEAVVVTALE